MKYLTNTIWNTKDFLKCFIPNHFQRTVAHKMCDRHFLVVSATGRKAQCHFPAIDKRPEFNIAISEAEFDMLRAAGAIEKA